MARPVFRNIGLATAAASTGLRRSGRTCRRAWSGLDQHSAPLHVVLIITTVALAWVTILVARDANDIAKRQADISRQQTQLMVVDQLPFIGISVERGDLDGRSSEGQHDIVVYNSGAPLRNFQVRQQTSISLCQHSDLPFRSNNLPCIDVRLDGYFDVEQRSYASQGELVRYTSEMVQEGNSRKLARLRSELDTLETADGSGIFFSITETLIWFTYDDLHGTYHEERFSVSGNNSYPTETLMDDEFYLGDVAMIQSPPPPGLDFVTADATTLVQWWEQHKSEAKSDPYNPSS